MDILESKSYKTTKKSFFIIYAAEASTRNLMIMIMLFLAVTLGSIL